MESSSATEASSVYQKHWWFFVTKFFPWLIPVVGLIGIGRFTQMSAPIHYYYTVAYGYLAGGLIVLIVLSLAICLLQWLFTTLTLDREYLIYRHGLISRQTTRVPLGEIASVALHQSFLQQLLGAGDIIVDMRGQALLRMRQLEKAPEIERRVMQLRRESASGRGSLVR